MDQSADQDTDLLIIGSGIAGLTLALSVNEIRPDISIILVTKNKIEEANTKYAQGGISSVISKIDSFASHIEDTLVAGAGLCRKEVVEVFIKEGPKTVDQLIKWGVNFDKTADNQIELGREGGHHERRVAHVKDYTGLAIQEVLIAEIHRRDSIIILENRIAIDLVNVQDQIAGAYIFNNNTKEVCNFSAKITVIATGGAGKVFRYTSNPDIASGDGIAMAYRAGARIANMEFIQFHPSILYNTELQRFLITEAIRGEGAILTSIDGRRFMENIHELKELAPRDIVSRAIDAEIKKTGVDHVLLDISFKDKEYVKRRFPAIYSTLLEQGIDITKEPIPIVPAAHYTIGGIKSATNGVTNLKGLLAIGEASCTGLHGANRLASNSLLEGSVMARKAANYIMKNIDQFKYHKFKKWISGDAVEPDEAVIITHNWAELRRLMWNYVGIVRTTKRLLRAKRRIEVLREEVLNYYWDFHVTKDIIELRNVVEVADLIVTSALARKESRGAHYTSDFPEKSDENHDTFILKNTGPHYSEIF